METVIGPPHSCNKKTCIACLQEEVLGIKKSLAKAVAAKYDDNPMHVPIHTTLSPKQMEGLSKELITEVAKTVQKSGETTASLVMGDNALSVLPTETTRRIKDE